MRVAPDCSAGCARTVSAKVDARGPVGRDRYSHATQQPAPSWGFVRIGVDEHRVASSDTWRVTANRGAQLTDVFVEIGEVLQAALLRVQDWRARAARAIRDSELCFLGGCYEAHWGHRAADRVISRKI